MMCWCWELSCDFSTNCEMDEYANYESSGSAQRLINSDVLRNSVRIIGKSVLRVFAHFVVRTKALEHLVFIRRNVIQLMKEHQDVGR
jgi:hypothetical protein